MSISGKDGVGQIGLTGPKGKDGKDGASINITTDNGKQTLVNREVGADGKPGKTTQRIITYQQTKMVILSKMRTVIQSNVKLQPWMMA